MIYYRFKYHMKGGDVGSLNVYTIVPEYYNTLEPHHFFTLIFNISPHTSAAHYLYIADLNTIWRVTMLDL